MRTETSGTEKRIDRRLRRACEESMTVIPVGGGEFDVYSGTKGVYRVDITSGECDCADQEHNVAPGECKHALRVELEAINNTLGEHVDAEPVFGERDESEPESVTVADAKPARAVRVATDGGVLLEEPDENESKTGATADVDLLEVNRIATEAVASGGGRLADFDVFCVTVEATQDALLRTAQAEN